MAFPFGSRTLADPIPTLADVFVIVAEHPALPTQRRQNMLSALRTVGRVLSRSWPPGLNSGNPLERIPADPRRLAQEYKRIAPLALGMSPGRWANVRSLVHAAIGLALETSPGRHRNPLLPGWQAKMDLLPPAIARPLSRFAHFCSMEGKEPERVEAETFSDFRLYVDKSPSPAPAQLYWRATAAWKEAQAAVPSWPGMTVPIPNSGRRWTLAWDSFPPSLREDVKTFFAPRAIRTSFEDEPFDEDPFADEPVRPLRPATIADWEWKIRAFASALVRRGYEPASLTSLRDLTEVQAFKDGLRYLFKYWGPKSHLTPDVARLLKAIAHHYCRVDPPDLESMASAIRILDRRTANACGRSRGGMTETNTERLRPFRNERNAVRLRDLSLHLKRIVDSEPRPYPAAILAEIAVAIELLVFTRLRISNLAALDLERNFRPGQENELMVVVEAEDVKNREPLECPLPKRTVDLLDWYFHKYRQRLLVYRRCLLAPLSSAVFPGRSRKTKKKEALAQQIKRRIFIHTGFEFNPHLFRHFTAQAYLERHPGGYEVVRRALAHRSLKTTISHYTGLEGPAAVRHFNREILKLGVDA